MIVTKRTCLLLVLVILVQEGKGGGIAGAFGGAAAESFGVKAGSVNRFTAVLAAIFMGLAVYVFVSIYATFMTQPYEFYLVAGMVGLVQGGVQLIAAIASSRPENIAR